MNKFFNKVYFEFGCLTKVFICEILSSYGIVIFNNGKISSIKIFNLSGEGVEGD